MSIDGLHVVTADAIRTVAFTLNQSVDTTVEALILIALKEHWPAIYEQYHESYKKVLDEILARGGA